MKIDPAFSASLSSLSRAGHSRPAAPGFQRAMAEAPTESTRAASVARASHLNLISAIAGEGDKQQKRQRRHSHAQALLDRLVGLALGLISGRVESDVLSGLEGALQGGEGVSDDPALEALVEAVELRAAVEMAKLKALKQGRGRG